CSSLSTYVLYTLSYTTLFRSGSPCTDSRPNKPGGHARYTHTRRSRMAVSIVGGSCCLWPQQDLGRGRGKKSVGARLRGRSVSGGDRKSTRLNSSHLGISYAVF